MSDLWIYRRRQSSVVRYRHGGAAAFEPAMRSPLAGVLVAGGPAFCDDQKILQFPTPAPATGSRPKRAGKPRGARAKPPKKRDS